MNIRHLFIALGITSILILNACGGNATPAPTVASNTKQQNVEPTEAPTATMQSSSNTANNLATNVVIVQNPPTVVPSGKITPAPKVTFTRKFHFGSLDGTILGWQIVPGDGVICPTINNENLALDVKLVNTAPAEYSIGGDYIKVLDAHGAAPDTLAQGSMGTGKGGSNSGVTVPASGSLQQTWCTDFQIKTTRINLSSFWERKK